MLADVEGSDISKAWAEWVLEHAAVGEELKHPFPTEWGGHDLLGVGDVVGFGESGGFLCETDGFAVGVV